MCCLQLNLDVFKFEVEKKKMGILGFSLVFVTCITYNHLWLQKNSACKNQNRSAISMSVFCIQSLTYETKLIKRKKIDFPEHREQQLYRM